MSYHKRPWTTSEPAWVQRRMIPTRCSCDGISCLWRCLTKRRTRTRAKCVLTSLSGIYANASVPQRSHIVESEPFSETFGPKAQRKKPRIDSSTFEELGQLGADSHDDFVSAAETNRRYSLICSAACIDVFRLKLLARFKLTLTTTSLSTPKAPQNESTENCTKSSIPRTWFYISWMLGIHWVPCASLYWNT